MKADEWGKPPIDLEGNKPASLGNSGRDAYLASNWIVAIDAWDFCDDYLLSEMLRRHPIPFELQPVIADIVSGKRVQNKRAAAKLKIPASHRMIYAGIYAELKEEWFDETLQHETHGLADERGVEVAEMRRQLQASAKRFKARCSSAAGVSVETLENLYDTLREKIKNYPNI